MWASLRRKGAPELTPSGPALDDEDDGPLDSRTLEQWLPGGLRHPRAIGWRLRVLLGAALMGCLVVAVLANMLARQPALGGQWRSDPGGRPLLVATSDPQLRPMLGRSLERVFTEQGVDFEPEARLLTLSPRWMHRDADRQRAEQQQRLLDQALESPMVGLLLSDGSQIAWQPRDRGIAGLGLLFWLVAALGLLVYVVALAVLLSNPLQRNLLFALIALAQCGNLLFIAVEASHGLGRPGAMIDREAWLRSLFDLVTAAGIIHVAAVHPTRVPGASAIAGAAWAAVLLLALAMATGLLAGAWWWTQATGLALGVAAIAILAWSQRLQPHPFALVLSRFGVVAVGTWCLLTLAVATASNAVGAQQQVARVGPMVWVVFLASLLLLVPFLARSQQVLREFSLLAAISTIAFSLDLLFVSLFSFGPFGSITLTLFLSLWLYTALRSRLMGLLRGSGGALTMERLFERLYRMAREVERQPQTAGTQLLALLREMFEPLEALIAPRASQRARVSRDGSTLLVPLPDLSRASGRADHTLVLRFSRGGRRLFTDEDARLSERIVEQLRRAVAYDQAVERGRHEERSRLAQDLHDDIGARLLTLMYQAPSPEQEQYIRHTLQDLKTLTRGLAAGSHRLADAIAEWKGDVAQRLKAANVTLHWQARVDEEVELGVVQWSALTRVLRELVSNALAHAQAGEIHVLIVCDAAGLTLSVADDGHGRAPQSWSAGLGVGGVRKRVKLLGGEVGWRELEPQGIECRVRLPPKALRQAD